MDRNSAILQNETIWQSFGTGHYCIAIINRIIFKGLLNLLSWNLSKPRAETHDNQQDVRIYSLSDLKRWPIVPLQKFQPSFQINFQVEWCEYPYPALAYYCAPVAIYFARNQQKKQSSLTRASGATFSVATMEVRMSPFLRVNGVTFPFFALLRLLPLVAILWIPFKLSPYVISQASAPGSGRRQSGTKAAMYGEAVVRQREYDEYTRTLLLLVPNSSAKSEIL